MGVRVDIKHLMRYRQRRSIREIRPGEGAGSLPEGWCILIDDLSQQLTDDEGNILVALCV